MSKQRILVNIFNEQYALKSDLPEQHVQELAEYVDSRMKKISSIQPSLSSSRIAVLVALELADESIKNKKAYEGLISAIKEEMLTSF